MPRRNKQIYESSRPYHVVGNALEKRGIFETPKDCARFLFQMYAANVGSPAPNMHRADIQHLARMLLEGEEIPVRYLLVEHAPLVEFFSFALVRDHYHFGLVPAVHGGIPKYMQKLNLGFAKYFNLAHHRQGPLFETRFKAVPIRNPQQLQALVQHINVKSVLDVYKPNWHKKGFDDEDLAIDFLSEYPYSSFPDLFKQRKSVLLSQGAQNEVKKFLKEGFLKKRESFIEVFKSYLDGEINRFEHILLEPLSV